MFRRRHNIPKDDRTQRGQSLVEVAVFLPIFVILIAGLVEVSNLVLSQNRISNAARVSTRFAANGGEDNGMWIVALNSVTQTLSLDDDRWDIWSIRGTVKLDSNVPPAPYWDDFSMTHIYGVSNTADYDLVAGPANEAIVQTRLLSEIIQDDNPDDGDLPPTSVTGPEGLMVVGSIMLFDAESILGLNQFFDGFYSVQGYSVMRRPNTIASEATTGCKAMFPFAFEEGVRSVTESAFPPPGQFSHPSSNQPDATDFPVLQQLGDVEVGLEAAREGIPYLFEFPGVGSNDRNFGFLSWDKDVSVANSTDLVASLTYPGNSSNWFQPGDSSDTEIQVGNTVHANTAVNGAVWSAVNGHIDRIRSLRILVFDDDGPTTPAQYQAQRFAIFRIRGYSLTNQWLMAEFIRWDESCGQTLGGP